MSPPMNINVLHVGRKIKPNHSDNLVNIAGYSH